jgi:hypothetical protein
MYMWEGSVRRCKKRVGAIQTVCVCGALSRSVSAGQLHLVGPAGRLAPLQNLKTLYDFYPLWNRTIRGFCSACCSVFSSIKQQL